MVTVASPGSPTVTSVGSEDGLIVILKFSLLSYIPSLFIGILNETVVIPAGNVTGYGPEI